MIDPLGPQKRQGSLAPLFVRLTDHEPEVVSEIQPYGFLTPLEVKNSIFEELGNLLNTRATSQHPDQKPYGIMPHFGIENFSIYDGISSVSWPVIATSLEATIRTFEPRLHNPEVQVVSYNSMTQMLNLHITGVIEMGMEKERLSFHININPS